MQGGFAAGQFLVAEHGDGSAGAEKAGKLSAWGGEMDAVEGNGFSVEADLVVRHDWLAVPVRAVKFPALLDEVAAQADELPAGRNVEIGKTPLEFRAAAAGVLEQDDVGFLGFEETGKLLSIALADIVRDEGQLRRVAVMGRRAVKPRVHVEQDQEKGGPEWNAQAPLTKEHAGNGETQGGKNKNLRRCEKQDGEEPE